MMRSCLSRPAPRDPWVYLPFGVRVVRKWAGAHHSWGPRARKVVRAVRAGAPLQPQKGGVAEAAERSSAPAASLE